jgi:hypothetical protein
MGIYFWGFVDLFNGKNEKMFCDFDLGLMFHHLKYCHKIIDLRAFGKKREHIRLCWLKGVKATSIYPLVKISKCNWPLDLADAYWESKDQIN